MEGSARQKPGLSYRGERAVLASMHRKEEAFAGPFRDILGINVEVAEGLDTDAFGTFSGEIPRRFGMLETAIAKARQALERSDARLAIASEGSFGPHPQVPFLAAGIELAVLIDRERDLVIHESLIDDAPVYHHAEVESREALEPHLARMQFPEHRLIVRPALGPGHPVFKGIDSEAGLCDALSRASAASLDGKAFVQTDMRAHMNPRRMATLRTLAERLASRAGCACPACAAPGFGPMRRETGLPCSDCGAPTLAIRHEVSGCLACGFEVRIIPPDRPDTASPALCPVCNP